MIKDWLHAWAWKLAAAAASLFALLTYAFMKGKHSSEQEFLEKTLKESAERQRTANEIHQEATKVAAEPFKPKAPDLKDRSDFENQEW